MNRYIKYKNEKAKKMLNKVNIFNAFHFCIESSGELCEATLHDAAGFYRSIHRSITFRSAKGDKNYVFMRFNALKRCF